MASDKVADLTLGQSRGTGKHSTIPERVHKNILIPARGMGESFDKRD